MRQMRSDALLMARDRDGAIADGYGVSSDPNPCMIDPQGRLVSHLGYGEKSLDAVINGIRRLLTEELQRQQAARQAAVPDPAGTSGGTAGG